MRSDLQKRIILLLAMTIIGAGCAAAEDTHLLRVGVKKAEFEWPKTDPNAIPDARLHELVKEARERAEQAQALAKHAEKLATMFDAELSDNNYTPETVSDGVVFIGRNAPHAGLLPDNVYVGKMKYDTGAEIVGVFEFTDFPNRSHLGTGAGKAPEGSPMKIFVGQFAVPADIRTRPAEGVAEFRNGDRFTGTYYLYFGDTDAIGIYQEAGGERRFVGQLSTSNNLLQPKSGIVENQNGTLLSVVVGDRY